MGYWANLLGTLEPILKIGLHKAALDTSTITAPRVFQLPNTSGTIALTSQLGALESQGIYLDWLLALSYATGNSANGAIKQAKSPATYVAGVPYYKVQPYFASLAAMYLLKCEAVGAEVVVRGWITWWATHRQSVEKTPLVYYYRADGTGEATSLPTASPAVPADFEDATDSNAALFFCVVARYINKYGRANLPSNLLTVLQETYDYLSSPALKNADNLTWAKASYPIKFLLDNVEVWAGLAAVTGVFTYFGDTARASSSKVWGDALKSTLKADFKQESTGLWRISKDGAGAYQNANMAIAYPDTVAQTWPLVFGLDYGFSGYGKTAAAWPDWDVAALGGVGSSVGGEIALAALTTSQADRVQAWLNSVAAFRYVSGDFTGVFTCADAAFAAFATKSFQTLPSSALAISDAQQALRGTVAVVCPANSDLVRKTVYTSAVAASSVINASIGSVATVEHSADEHLIEQMTVRVANIVPGVSFDLVLIAGSVSGISGSWNINWTLNA
jgi:hypothetical protein